MTDSVAMGVFQPTAERLRLRKGDSGEILARPDLLLWTQGTLPGHPWSSTVYWARWSEAEVDARIDEVLEFFRARRRAFVWLVTDRSRPASLGERLAAHGFIRELEGRMLVAALPIVGLRVHPAVRVEMVTDRAGLRDGLRVDHPDWDDARVAPQLEDRLRRLSKDFHVAVAYADDRPVGTARWTIDRAAHLVEFGGAETLVEYRNRGIYSSLVAFRAEHAMREGCTHATIIADRSTSGPILLKRGFADLGAATYYLWPSRQFRQAQGSDQVAVADTPRMGGQPRTIWGDSGGVRIEALEWSPISPADGQGVPLVFVGGGTGNAWSAEITDWRDAQANSAVARAGCSACRAGGWAARTRRPRAIRPLILPPTSMPSSRRRATRASPSLATRWAFRFRSSTRSAIPMRSRA